MGGVGETAGGVPVGAAEDVGSDEVEGDGDGEEVGV